MAQHLQLAAPADPLVVVGHGSAGPLLPALARTQRAGGRHIAGYVFVDATLPRPGPTSHLDLLKAAAPDEERLAHEHLHAPGGVWPALADSEKPFPGESRGTVPHTAQGPAQGLPQARPRDHQFWSETLPPAIDWPDAPCAYVHTGQPAPGCGDVDFWARSARSRGWPVTEEPDPLQGVRASLDHLPG
ncbi:hypothetical protein G1H11_10755 [Phytoactinopolyspora alkaliphila]|uniref:Alpha/beta hydrolase n=1 Tax=Phytoactinopolyspora alkaliphila TaxID=1783498 RepID=A0A6N9YLG6_9ACTN|nr:hypothetical protein [Phytoactinopolyspora alkaliphila]NED95792.1 hypothetical protein [Phytoactinopolyspora alkaliphila]